MTDPIDPCSTPASMPASLALAWLEDSSDLLALTDATGRIAWTNAAFTRTTGLAADADLLSLAPGHWQDGQARVALQAWAACGVAASGELCLPCPRGEPWWAQVRVTVHHDQR